jgi:hypothetical protein
MCTHTRWRGYKKNHGDRRGRKGSSRHATPIPLRICGFSIGEEASSTMKAEPKVARLLEKAGFTLRRNNRIPPPPQCARRGGGNPRISSRRGTRLDPSSGSVTSTLAAPTMKKRGHPTAHELRAMLRLSLQETTPKLNVAVSIEETTKTTTKPRWGSLTRHQPRKS